MWKYNYGQETDLLFRDLPRPLSWLARRRAGKHMTASAWKQGMGRHSLEEVTEIAKKDLRAISSFLGKWHDVGARGICVYVCMCAHTSVCVRCTGRFWLSASTRSFVLHRPNLVEDQRHIVRTQRVAKVESARHAHPLHSFASNFARAASFSSN